MENLSEYIPLLIILATLVFSFIRSPKKKEEETKKSSPLPNPPVFPDISREKSKTSQTDSNELRKKLDVILKKESEKEKKFSLSNRSKTPSNSNVSKTTPVVLAEEDYPEPFIDVSDMDEVKKAIIYAEIFTRKEY